MMNRKEEFDQMTYSIQKQKTRSIQKPTKLNQVMNFEIQKSVIKTKDENLNGESVKHFDFKDVNISPKTMKTHKPT